MGIVKVGGALFAFRTSEVAGAPRALGAAIDTPVWIAASLSNLLSRSSSARVSARLHPIQRYAPLGLA